MHIFHLNEFPLFEIFSEGNDHDAPYAIPLAEAVIQMNPSMTTIQLDGGYDSFAIYTGYWKMFRILPLIAPNENAVINKDGTMERIDHWLNKMWKKGAIFVIQLKINYFISNNGEGKLECFYAIRI